MNYAEFNPFQANVPFRYPQKISENQRFSDFFRGYRRGILTWNELIHGILSCANLAKIYANKFHVYLVLFYPCTFPYPYGNVLNVLKINNNENRATSISVVAVDLLFNQCCSHGLKVFSILKVRSCMRVSGEIKRILGLVKYLWWNFFPSYMLDWVLSSPFRGVFRTLLLVVNYFHKTLHLRCLTGLWICLNYFLVV